MCEGKKSNWRHQVFEYTYMDISGEVWVGHIYLGGRHTDCTSSHKPRWDHWRKKQGRKEIHALGHSNAKTGEKRKKTTKQMKSSPVRQEENQGEMNEEVFQGERSNYLSNTISELNMTEK